MSRAEIYFVNVQERRGRCWDEFRREGYLSSLGCVRTLDAFAELTPGDRIAAYLRRCGYVGIGVVLGWAQPMAAITDEYVVPVRWLRTVDREGAKWLPRCGLYASPQIKSPLAAQRDTLLFLQKVFSIPLSGAALPFRHHENVIRIATRRPDRSGLCAATAAPRLPEPCRQPAAWQGSAAAD